MSAIKWPTVEVRLTSAEGRRSLPAVGLHANTAGFSFYTYLTVDEAKVLRDQLARAIEYECDVPRVEGER